MPFVLQILALCFLLSAVYADRVEEKVLICGICKDVEKAVANTMSSVQELGEHFSDYRVIIYENNSKDRTKELLGNWAKSDPHVIFISEDLSKKAMAKELKMKVCNRTEMIARARNKVLDVAFEEQFDDYKYVIWADLDFLHPWDVKNIVETIVHPQEEWDAVLANGAYDIFALRDPEFPIGFELLGELYWTEIDKIRARFSFDPEGAWRKVYSAFGGLGIYKRASIRGCRYSGVVTKDLEKVVASWLVLANTQPDVCSLKEYKQLLTSTPIIEMKQDRLSSRKRLADKLGVRMKNGDGEGQIVWFSCTRKKTLPWTCEHVPFHASMILHGNDKIFINPRLISDHPE